MGELGAAIAVFVVLIAVLAASARQDYTAVRIDKITV